MLRWQAGAKTPQRCKLILMDELQTLRKTSNTLDSVGNAGGAPARIELGVKGQVFTFDHCENEVTFLASSLKTGDGADQIRDFLKQSKA